MIHHYHRDIQRQAQGLGKGCPDKERTEKARSPGKCNCGKLRSLHSRLFESLAHYRNNILLVGPRRKFRNDSAIVLMDLLAGDDI